jgi:hypothetical protein
LASWQRACLRARYAGCIVLLKLDDGDAVCGFQGDMIRSCYVGFLLFVVGFMVEVENWSAHYVQRTVDDLVHELFAGMQVTPLRNELRP